MVKALLGVSIKNVIRNLVIRQRTKLNDVVLKVNRLKWQWAGHICRGPISARESVLWDGDRVLAELVLGTIRPNDKTTCVKGPADRALGYALWVGPCPAVD